MTDPALPNPHRLPLADANHAGRWRDDPVHREWLAEQARAQLRFFRASLRADGGFDSLDLAGRPIPGAAQELHATTRLVHSYALAQIWGRPGCTAMIEAGMAALWSRHRDSDHGGYVWSVDGGGAILDATKLAYGHVFVLLAAASAHRAGHPDAPRLIDDITAILDRHFWDEDAGLFRDEFTRDWQPFSTYRGMNANMHGVEALLAAHKATGAGTYLARAGRILDFFVGRMAPAHGWRLPEHYHADWTVDPDYSGNPMFRPAGTTPGHSFEMGRLVLEHWHLAGRPDTGAPLRARRLIEQAWADGWLEQDGPEQDGQAGGGLAYTLDRAGTIAIADRYWWPVTEAIGAYATLIEMAPDATHSDTDEARYRRLWRFADAHLIDHAQGGWFPELDSRGQPVGRQFIGKPDLYHALQATLIPLGAAG